MAQQSTLQMTYGASLNGATAAEGMGVAVLQTSPLALVSARVRGVEATNGVAFMQVPSSVMQVTLRSHDKCGLTRVLQVNNSACNTRWVQTGFGR